MSELSNAIKQICEEKGLSFEAVVATIESALAAAYRKDFGEKNQNIKVEFSPETGESKVFDVKTVVEDRPPEEEAGEEEAENAPTPGRPAEEEAGKQENEEEAKKFNPKTDLPVSEAQKLKKDAQIGEEIRTELPVPAEYGRMAAQTAKQVIIQRLREAERNMIFEEFKGKENEVVGGVVQRHEGRIVLIDLGRAVAVLPPKEQIGKERYLPGERFKVFIKEVRISAKGPEIIVSRAADEILKKVFYLEIPEIANGLIEIKSVAREAGVRAKVAVATEAENVDPIGSCVGQRGARIQTIISELGGEKIDIILYDEDPAKFIANALAPAKIASLELRDTDKKAIVSVPADQFSLAIGKGGQNVRLAAKLTGWMIDIVEKKETLAPAEATEEKNVAAGETAPDEVQETPAAEPDKGIEPEETGPETAKEEKIAEENGTAEEAEASEK